MIGLVRSTQTVTTSMQAYACTVRLQLHRDVRTLCRRSHITERNAAALACRELNLAMLCVVVIVFVLYCRQLFEVGL